MWAHRVDAAVPRATRHRCGLSHGIQQQCRLRGAVAARLQATRRALQGGGGDGDAAARRAFADALADGLHDLSLDFDAAYLQHRSHASVPVLLGGEAGGDSAVADTALPGDAACGGAAAALEAFLHFSRIVQPGGVLEETGRDNTGRGGLGSSAPAAPEGGDLLSCAVLLARHAHGAADAGAVRDAVDALGAEAAAAAAAAAPGAYGPSGARALADAVSGVLYRTHGFAGAEGHIYHPDSHCINRALDTRSGSPALLALLYKLVAARAGLHCVPVTLPGHTFLQLLLPGSSDALAPFLLDPFNAGQLCSSSVVEARLSAAWGYSGTLGVTAALGDPAAVSCDAASWRGDRALLVRLLKNLREAYYAPLPLSGRVRWAVTPLPRRGGAAAAGLPGDLDAAAASDTGGSPPPPLSAGDDAGPPPCGRELLHGALAVVRFHRATAPHEARLLRDEGVTLHLLGRGVEGSKLLQQYLAATPHAADAHKVREFVLADAPAAPPPPPLA